MTIHEPRRRAGGVPAPGGPPPPEDVATPEEPAPGADAAGGVQPGSGGGGVADAPGLPARVLRLLTVLGTCLVAIAEVDRLTAGLRDAEDRSVSLLALVGARRAYGFATGGGEAFGRLHQGGILSGTGIRWWLVLYAVLHVVAVVCFVALARRGLGLPRLVGGERPPGERGSGLGVRRRLRARLAVDLDERRGPAVVLALVLAVWVVVDALVVVLAVLAGDTGRSGPAALTGDIRDLELATAPRLVADAVGWGATIGWLLVLLAVAMLVRRLVLGVRLESGATWRPELRRVRRAGRALYIHRFSLVVVVVIGGLVVLPGGEILDQFPDAARAWVDPDGSGAWHALWGVVSLLALTTAVFVLGRLRSTLAYHRYARREPDKDPSLWAHAAWLAVPALVAGAGWLVADRGWGEVDTGALTAFAAPIVAIVLLSLLLRYDVVPRLWRLVRRRRGAAAGATGAAGADDVTGAAGAAEAADLADPAPPAAPAIPPIDEPEEFALLVWRTGDVLALTLVAVASVGLVRAFTAPFALGSPSSGLDGPATAAFAVGAGLAVAWWPVAATLLRAQDKPSAGRRRGLQWLSVRLRPDERPSGKAGLVDAAIALALAVAALAGLGGLLLYPFTWAAALGVVAVTTLALGCVVVLVSVAVLRVQRSRPLEVFGLVGLRRTPLLTLVLAVPVAASLTGGDPDVHSIRTLSAATSEASRPTLGDAFRTWLTSRPGCTAGPVTVAGRKLPVRPMVLVAAAGGGIRAAAWTAYGVDHLAEHCGDTPVFLSSGVSGGSVGLALARRPKVAGEAADLLAEQTALSAAVDGLVVRDVLGGATGIRVYDRDHEPRPEWHEPPREWLDRAGLMERAWESDAKELARPFLSGPGTSGYLLLNSTSVGTACRMIVSDIRLSAAAEGGYTRRTEVTTATRQQDPDCHTPVTGLPAGSVDLLQAYDCLGPLRASTAAMLSARFPYVTPSGVVRGCGETATQQLVDGGYAEASALGTLVDLAPELMRLVRAHNAAVLGDPAASEPLVVPTVVFLQNHFGTDLSAPPSASSSELLVPPIARRAKNELGSDSALRQRLEALLADPVPCPAKAAGCVPAGPAGVPPYVLVAPATLPSVTAPLGWTLSQTSIDRLRTAMDRQATCEGEPADGQPPRLCDLRRALTPPKP